MNAHYQLGLNIYQQDMKEINIAFFLVCKQIINILNNLRTKNHNIVNRYNLIV